MKRIILFLPLSAFAITLTGCDPIGSYYWNIKNDTDSDLVVGIEGEVPGAPEKQFVIESGEIEMVYSDAIMGTRGEDRFEAGQIMCYSAVKINGRPVLNEIWRRSNWEFTRNEGFSSTYTLTVTEELLERLVNKEDPPAISVSDPMFAVGVEGAELVLRVMSNTDWVADAGDDDWVHISTDGERGSHNIRITVDPWNEAVGESRNARITFRTTGGSETVVQTVDITQFSYEYQ